MIEQAHPNTTGERRADRTGYEAKVQFRAGNRRADVKVLDISGLGARISGVFLVHDGDRFFLKIGNLEPIEARVAWVTDFEFGCEFLRPINEVILEALTNRRM
ncbi:MAG: PilZ domain-containing protein [Novosphingobium sp.]|uniref:PilZ domain-containing protein n=1 Tax=Novosphingobium sp. TaxID=1874826 RepID=UPI0032B95A8A